MGEGLRKFNADFLMGLTGTAGHVAGKTVKTVQRYSNTASTHMNVGVNERGRRGADRQFQSHLF
jgi:hypothetical protein